MKTRGPAFVLALLAAFGPGLAGAEPARVGDLLARLEPVPEIAVEDLQAGLLARKANLILPADAPRVAALQALATAAGVRFRRAGSGILGSHVTNTGPLNASMHPSGLRDRSLTAPVKALLAPWWSPATGLDHDTQFGEWSATLPDDGQRRLIEVLSLLDHPRPQLPPALVAPETPSPTASLAGLTTWEDLAARLSCPVVTTVLWPAVPAVSTVAELVPALTAAGVPAAWVHGALCLGDRHDRQDATEATAVACLPLPPRTPAERILPVWDEPGWGTMVRGNFVIAVATPAALQDLQARFDAVDRGEQP